MTAQSFQTQDCAYREDDPSRGSVLASVQQTETLARAHQHMLQQRTEITSDELAQTADELAQLAEYLGEVNASRSQFLSKVAHELRTPLTIAKGWMSMLRYGELLPGQERIVGVVEQQIDELTRLVNDLLDLSRREAGVLTLRLERVNVVALAQQVAEHQRELTSIQGIQLFVRSQCPDAYAYIDRGRIAQVLNNLISNACRYVPHHEGGWIELFVTADETTVQICVRDNGVGIAPEHLPRIFEPFYQIEAQRRSGKSGLGLTVAQELVIAHGGSLRVESVVGEGTCFRIWLRRVADGEGAAK